MTNKEFNEYRSGKNCASEFISECINKHVNQPNFFSKKQLKDVLQEQIILCNNNIKDNHRTSFNTGYKEVINDFLTFITK